LKIDEGPEWKRFADVAQRVVEASMSGFGVASVHIPTG